MVIVSQNWPFVQPILIKNCKDRRKTIKFPAVFANDLFDFLAIKQNIFNYQIFLMISFAFLKI